jgi:hypothetical protein
MKIEEYGRATRIGAFGNHTASNQPARLQPKFTLLLGCNLVLAWGCNLVRAAARGRNKTCLSQSRKMRVCGLRSPTPAVGAESRGGDQVSSFASD